MASPDVHPVQLELMRRATPARRLALALSLSQSALDLSRRAIRRRHPESSDEELGLRFVEVTYGADLAARVRRYLRER